MKDKTGSFLTTVGPGEASVKNFQDGTVSSIQHGDNLGAFLLAGNDLESQSLGIKLDGMFYVGSTKGNVVDPAIPKNTVFKHRKTLCGAVHVIVHHDTVIDDLADKIPNFYVPGIVGVVLQRFLALKYLIEGHLIKALFAVAIESQFYIVDSGNFFLIRRKCSAMA